ncbi:MAG TPA: histidinol-phosphate transaminase [Gammaproteobacteria bacterium]|jgi:histidinol-phosphate aminotransferase|nr:histidinol-phosphate transaminase [Gammaproteobacteria bacterium]
MAIIGLANNENPLGSSPRAMAGARAALQSLHLYPDTHYIALKEALGAHMQVAPTQITIGNGSESILELIIRTHLHQGQSAVISEYAFLTVPLLLKNYGIHMNTAKACCFGHDPAALLKAIDEKTRAIFIINPNNPTGTFLDNNALTKLIKDIPSHILIVIDEAYAEYRQDPDCPQSISYVNQYPNLIVMRTFSKIYGLAALRIGYAVASTEITNRLNHSQLPFHTNSVAVAAAHAALADQMHVTRSLIHNQQGMAKLTTALSQLGFSFIPSAGNFLAIRVKQAQVYYHALLKAGIAIKPLDSYQMPDYIRVSIGTFTEIDAFLAALADISVSSISALQ